MDHQPVRIGMMSFAHMHAWSYASAIKSRPDTELVGIADADPERARRVAGQLSATVFNSYEELLAVPGLDAVVVCPENVNHRPLVEMAAAAGKHILCEKPLAPAVADAEAMIAAADAAGVGLMTAFPCRFSPVMKRLSDTVASGRTGRILALRGTNRGRNPGGWFADPALAGGGAVMDHTVHVADLMRWLVGEDIAEVYAEIGNGMFHAGFDDTGFLSMRFSGGAVGTLDASWTRPRTFPTWGDVTLDVLTENGMLSMDMFAQNLVHYSDAQGGVSWLNWGSNADSNLVGAFAHAVATGEPMPVTGQDGLAAVRVAVAAYESARVGRPVPTAA